MAGAKKVYAFATHGLLSGPAIPRIAKSQLTELVITDTVRRDDEREHIPNITVVSICVLVADALRRIYQKESLGDVFYGKKPEEEGAKKPDEPKLE